MKKAVTFILLSFFFTKASYAYIDPGSGSFFFQMIIAGLLSLTVTIKPVKEKLLDLLKRVLPKTDNKDEKK